MTHFHSKRDRNQVSKLRLERETEGGIIFKVGNLIMRVHVECLYVAVGTWKDINLENSSKGK